MFAARLTEDPDKSALLLEAGGSDRKLTISMPAAIPFVYQDQTLNWGEHAGPEPYLTGPDIDEKRGRVLGGSSSINAMIFNRGNPRDFDGWEEMGLPDWSWRNVLRYFKRMECFEEGASETRGGAFFRRLELSGPDPSFERHGKHSVSVTYWPFSCSCGRYGYDGELA